MHWKDWFFAKAGIVPSPAALRIMKEVKYGGTSDLDQVAAVVLDKPSRLDVDWTAVRYTHLYLRRDRNQLSSRAFQSFTRNFKRLLSHKLVLGYPKGWDDALGFASDATSGKISNTRPTAVLVSEADYNTIVDFAASQWVKGHKPEATRLAFAFAYYLGLNMVAVQRIRLNDIFKKDGNYLVYSSSRLIDIPSHMVALLEERMSDRANIKARIYSSPTLFTYDQTKYIAKYPELSKALTSIKRVRA